MSKLMTPYEEIVDVKAIGGRNTRNQGDLFMKATQERLNNAKMNKERVMVIAIDFQNDFMENGSLAVPNSHGDIERATRWIYNNMDGIYQITTSIDTHIPQQIFHPYWWVDSNGNNPPPFTVITLKDLDDGKWFPIIEPDASREYVKNLEAMGKKVLCIWTYHCLLGTEGHALESQFSNMVYFHSVAKKMGAYPIMKGNDPLSEMYGIFKPEYSPKNQVNTKYLNYLENFDKIVIMGEASSHCVLESIKQIGEFHATRPDITSKVYILEDCMSSVIHPVIDFPAIVKQEFDNFKKTYKMNIVKSTDFTI